MELTNFIKGEFQGWGKYEKIFFPLIIFSIISISIYMDDSKIALVSAVCGISYTILAGKGKISCYLIGMIGTLCYVYIAFQNNLYGNMLLYLLYYFPMQAIGIFQWKKHLREDTAQIIKTKLDTKKRTSYFIIALVISIVFSIVLKQFGNATPYMDGITTVLSVFGLILTIKRCIEQWYIWLIVNGLSATMWIKAYINGSNCFATVLMWCIYFFLAIYFLNEWKKEIANYKLSEKI